MAFVSNIDWTHLRNDFINVGMTQRELSKKYGVSVKQLRRLNNIRGNNITAGKTLRIR